MREQQSMTRLSLLHIQDRTEAGSIESDSASTTTTPRTILSAHNAASPAATLGLQRGGLSSSSSLGVDTEQRPSTPHRTSRLSRSITPVSQRASEQAIPLACQLNAMTIIYYIHTHNILVILVYILKGARLHASLSLSLSYILNFLSQRVPALWYAPPYLLFADACGCRSIYERNDFLSPWKIYVDFFFVLSPIRDQRRRLLD